jgi:hypothetical protein
MEDFKTFLEAISGLVEGVPDVALWIIGMFFVFKLTLFLSVTGSTVLLGKLAINKLHSWATKEKINLTDTSMYFTDAAEGIVRLAITTDGTDARLIRLLRTKISGKRCSLGSAYIHSDSVDWLEDAINEKEEREMAEAG